MCTYEEGKVSTVDVLFETLEEALAVGALHILLILVLEHGTIKHSGTGSFLFYLWSCQKVLKKLNFILAMSIAFCFF